MLCFKLFYCVFYSVLYIPLGVVKPLFVWKLELMLYSPKAYSEVAPLLYILCVLSGKEENIIE